MHQHSMFEGEESALKITIHDGAKAFRLQIEGKLAGAWVTELEQCWRTAASSITHKSTILELRAVTYVDDAGRYLLGLMHRSGVRLLANSPSQKELVTSITGESYLERPAASPANRVLRRLIAIFILLAVLLILHDTVALAREIPVSSAHAGAAITHELTHAEHKLA
jgi:hypothetical protein